MERHLAGLTLEQAVVAASGEPAPLTGAADEVIPGLLRSARELLDMDVAFVGQFRDGQRFFRYVDSADPRGPVRPGAGDPLELSYCHQVVQGRLPGLITDAAVVPAAADLPATAGLPVGAHLSVPITFSDGRVYGTFCAFSHAPDPSLRHRDLGVLQLLAQLVARYLEREAAADLRREQDIADILEVIGRDRLRTVFQPIVALDSGRVVGFEALTRFPSGRADLWFDRAGRAGLGTTLELASLEAAVAHLPHVAPHAYLSVNLSPAALCSEQFTALADELPLPRLVVELTEQTTVESYEDLARRTAWLRERGGRVAVDDAGSGYAGLQRILALAPDLLKLDRALTWGIAEDPARQALATAMRWFADRTGATLVAEGIETSDQVRVLRALGVAYGQGYHLGRPGPLTAAG